MKKWALVAGALACVLIAGGVWFRTAGRPRAGGPEPGDPPAPDSDTRPRVTRFDGHGDILPDGAIARLASLRHVSLGRGVAQDRPEGRHATFTADGQQVVIIFLGERVDFYETASGKLNRSVWLHSPMDAQLTRGQLSDDGRTAVVSSSRPLDANRDTRFGSIEVWDTTTGRLKKAIRAPFDPVQFAPWVLSDGNRMFRFSTEGTTSGPALIQEWDLTTGQFKDLSGDEQVRAAIRAAPPGTPQKVTSPDGRHRLEMKKLDNGYAAWNLVDATTGKAVWTTAPPASGIGRYETVHTTHDGRYVLASRNEGLPQIVVLDRQQPDVFVPASRGTLVGAGVSPDGKKFGWCIEDFARKDVPIEFAVFDPATRTELMPPAGDQEVKRWLDVGGPLVGDRAFWHFAADRLLGKGKGAGWLRPPDQFPVDQQELVELVRQATPDGRFVARSGQPKFGPPDQFPETITLWEVASGAPVARHPDWWNRVRYEYDGPDGTKKLATVDRWVTRLSLSVDGRRVFLFGYDGAREWDVLGGEPRSLSTEPVAQGWLARTTAAAVSQDGTTLVTAHRDGSVFAWDVAPRPLPALTADDREASWNDLARTDGARAIWRLAGDPAGSVPFLRERLHPASAGTGPEKGVLPAGETLRGVRAVAVLEYAGTAEAKQVLESLAAGSPAARLTLEAAAAIRRMRR